MSVMIRQTFRNAFATAVPVLMPLYNAGCGSWQIASEGEFQCGNTDRCQFPLRIEGIEGQHCSLLFRSGTLRIRPDKGRVWVNDLPVSGEADLLPGDILSIGPISFEVGQTVGRDEPKPAPTKAEISTPTIGDVSLASQPHSGSPQLGLPQSTEAIETASVLVRESVGVAETLLMQIEGQMRALEQQEQRCRGYAQAVEAREAAIRDHERRIEDRSEELTRLRQDLERQQAELSRQGESLKGESLRLAERNEKLETWAVELAEQKQHVDSAVAVSRSEAADRQESQSMEELAAIAYERESLLKARDEAIQSLAEMRNQHATLSQQETRLQTRQAEIDSREAELARNAAVLQEKEAELEAKAAELNSRVAELNSRVAEGLASQSADNAERQQLLEALRESEQRCQDLDQEREALLTAICELKGAFENARSDVEQASRIKAESAAREQTLSELHQRIEESGVQLTMKDSLLLAANEELDAVRVQAAQLTEERDELSRLIAAATVKGESDFDQETETQLLREIESLRDEVNQRSSIEQARQSKIESTLRDMLAQRDEQIRELQAKIDSSGEQLEALLSKTGEAPEQAEIDLLREQAEKADAVLRERDDVIRELRARLLQPSLQAPANVCDEARIQNESRELDRRAALLDQRDEDLRERCRRIDQSEEDIEVQRRQLLEARQQLEQARAEVQVAIKQHAVSGADLAPAESPSKSPVFGDVTPIFGGTLLIQESLQSRGSAAEVARTTDDAPAMNDLRFELAGLLGQHKSRDEFEVESAVPTQDFIDLSEPTGESQTIAFRFGEDATSFIQSLSADSAPNVAADAPREENSDDFVRDYMEQLLSRSRKSAGNALPEELKPAESSERSSGVKPDTTRTKASKEASSQQSSPKVRSFIDQYMSGDFGDLTGDGSISAPQASVSEEAPAIVKSQIDGPLVPRAKIDLRKMRENMDSFRTLSTQSVEHALVNHALRKERLNINGRIMFVLALLGVGLFLAFASARGIINYPLLIWGTFIATAGAALELGRTLYGMKARCKGAVTGKDTSDIQDANSVSEANASVSRHSFTPAVAGNEAADLSVETPELPPHPDLPDRPRTTISNDAERSSRYFEL